MSTLVPSVFDMQPMSLLAYDYVLNTNQRTLLIGWEISGFVGHNHQRRYPHNAFDYNLFNQSVDIYFGK